MKRISLFLIASLFIGIFILSSNSPWMEKWSAYRLSEGSSLPSSKYRFGDLYGFCYLPQFKFKEDTFSPSDLKPYYVPSHSANNVNLYSISDSYLENLNDSLLRNADGYRFTKWDRETKKFYLAPEKTNILLLELVERSVRNRLSDTAYVYKHLGVVDEARKEATGTMFPQSWRDTHVFNRNVETNLEFNLFDYSLFIPFKEMKATLNYTLFNRKSQNVFISKTKGRLYYNPTIDSTENLSSFNPLGAGEVDSLVMNLNSIYRHYRRAGFSEVYLAIMPNPVTIVEPKIGTYNGLIPRLQQHSALQMPILNIYGKFQRLNKRLLYQRSDSHWSKEGFLVGLEQIDSALATHSSDKLYSPPTRAITSAK